MVQGIDPEGMGRPLGRGFSQAVVPAAVGATPDAPVPLAVLHVDPVDLPASQRRSACCRSII